MFGLGSIAYAIAALALRNWRHLVTWVSLNSVVAAVGIFFLAESPRWPGLEIHQIFILISL